MSSVVPMAMLLSASIYSILVSQIDGIRGARMFNFIVILKNCRVAMSHVTCHMSSVMSMAMLLSASIYIFNFG